MKSQITDNRVNVRLFIEEIYIDSLVPSGKVVEATFFNSIVWNTSADFRKTATITFDNALEKLTTSIEHPEAHLGNPVNKLDPLLKDYTRRMFDSYKDAQVYYNPDNNPTRDTYLTRDDFLFGHYPLNSYVTTNKDLMRCFLPFQRIWILSESDIAGSVKYNIWSGLIVGLSDNFSEGGSTVSINVSGLSRLLELTLIFQHYRCAMFEQTIVTEYAKILNENLYQFYPGTEICSRLNPIGLCVLTVFLANFYFTAQGNSLRYGLPNFGIVPRNTAFFMQEPVWDLNTDSTICWDNIRNGDSSVLLPMPFSTEDPKIVAIISDLIAGNAVYTSQLIPSVYVDPLLMEVYNNSVNVFPTLFQQSNWLADLSSLDGKDLLLKAAQALLATVYEDDFGNIIMEVPKTWSAPDDTGSFITEPSYRKSPKSKLFRDVDHTLDYVIHDNLYSRYNKSFNEANIVSHVEVPVGYNFVPEINEVLQTMSFTGRTSILGDNNKYVEFLQKRFGLRVLTVNPITVAKYNLKSESHTAFMKALNAYAKTVLKLRNYACEALTMDFEVFMPHLAVNKNILFLHDEALWLIKDKTLSYTLNKDSASFTCSLVCSIRHKLYESAEYPFVNLIPELLG